SGIPRTSRLTRSTGPLSATGHRRKDVDLVLRRDHRGEGVLQVGRIAPVDKDVHVRVQIAFLVQQLLAHGWEAGNDCINQRLDSYPLSQVELNRLLPGNRA